MSDAELQALQSDHFIPDELERLHALTSESTKVLVEYRPAVGPSYSYEGNFESRQHCRLFRCGHNSDRFPVVISLTNVSLRPTSYSLRYERCYGASFWNFEGSEDGIEWTVLHEARDDPHLYDDIEKDLFASTTGEERLLYVELKKRHTWRIELDSPMFFKFFRIIGLGLQFADEDDERICIHVVGLELFGDIHED